MKEIELSRKLKLKKKVNNSHYRGRQICAYFDIQQVLDTIIPMLERYFTVVDLTNEEANCFLWDKTNHNVRSDEVTISIPKFCLIVFKKGVSEIDFFVITVGVKTIIKE